MSSGSAARTLATYHLFVMVAATALFVATCATQRPGYVDGEVTTLGLILGIAAFAVLASGGVLRGALAYVYGVRVVGEDVPIADALIPGRLEQSATVDAANRGQANWTGSSVRGGRRRLS